MKQYKKVYVEITNICNLQCSFCPVTNRKAEFMSLQGFKRILGQIKPFSDYIYLHVKGEPLLHPELGAFLDASYEENLKVNITTNGTLIPKVADMLIGKPAVRQINVSLHSFDGNEMVMEKEQYIDSILAFCSKAVAASQIIISLRLWNLEESLVTQDQRERNLTIIHKIEEYFTLADKIQGNLSANKSLKLGERIYLNQDHEFAWPDLKAREDASTGTCFGLRNQIAILVDGTVVPCCLDGEGIMNLGNIYQEEFADIIHKKRAIDIKRGFCNYNVVEELCRKCGYRKRFTVKAAKG